MLPSQARRRRGWRASRQSTAFRACARTQVLRQGTPLQPCRKARLLALFPAWSILESRSTLVPKSSVARRTVMARISGADPRKKGLLSGLLVRLFYWLTKRKLGKVVMPVQITSHHPRILWGYGQMEQAFLGSRLVETSLKNLAQLRAATLIGCPF